MFQASLRICSIFRSGGLEEGKSPLTHCCTVSRLGGGALPNCQAATQEIATIANPSNKLGKIPTSEASDRPLPGLEATSCSGLEVGSAGKGGGSSTAASEMLGGWGFPTISSFGCGGAVSRAGWCGGGREDGDGDGAEIIPRQPGHGPVIPARDSGTTNSMRQ